MVRQIFAQPTREKASQHLALAADNLARRFPKAAQMRLDAEVDVLSHMNHLSAHRRQIRSTNGLERLNREVARRFDAVGIFPDRNQVLRLGGAVLAEQDDEWLASPRYFSEESMAALTQPAATRPAFDPALKAVTALAQSA